MFTPTQALEIATQAAKIVLQETMPKTELFIYPNKLVMAESLGVTRKTVSAMIDRGEIEVLPTGCLKLINTSKIKKK